MRYRGGKDMQVSVYVAAFVITVFGSAMVLIIVRAITEVDFSSLTLVAS